MKLDFEKDRNDDFMRNYWSVLSKYGKNHTKKELINITINQEAERFYVSPWQAIRVIRKKLNGHQEIEIKSCQKQKMYQEIFRRVKILIEKGIPLTDAVFDVIYSKAPSFYIEQSSAQELVYKIIKSKKSNK